MESKSPEKVEMKWLFNFGPEVEKALKRYLEVREGITPLAGHEHALFYSAQRKRMGVQAVENMVKKNIPDRLRRPRKLRRISFEAPMVPHCTRKRAIFTL